MKTPSESTDSKQSSSPSAKVDPIAAYWQQLSGFAYAEMIRERDAIGNENYRQQERFLSAFIASEQHRHDCGIDVLEFGCGFGRHARYVSKIEHVCYYGYDFSAEMVTPL